MTAPNRRWFPRMAPVLRGCNSASSPSEYDVQAEEDLQDYTTIASMASARVAEENCPQPFTYSIERPT